MNLKTFICKRNYLKSMIFYGLGILIFQLYSCKDEYVSDKPVYTITGHLYNNCNSGPLVNFKLRLLQGGAYNPITGTSTGGEQATTTTDSNGYFKFEFKDLGGDNEVILYSSGVGYNAVMVNIPARISIDNIILYKQLTTNIQVRLNVINPHTSNDTLVMGNFKTMQDLRIPGPFTSGVLYTAANYLLSNADYSGETKQLNWYFSPYHGIHFSKEFIVNKYCSDTIFVTADIN